MINVLYKIKINKILENKEIQRNTKKYKEIQRNTKKYKEIQRKIKLH